MSLPFCFLLSAQAAAPPEPPFWTYPAGDVNGDGLVDVVVASDPGREGIVQVYHGLPDGTLPTEPDTTIRPDPCYHDDTLDIVITGDLDTDGYSDLVVSMEGRNQRRGAAMVYTGGPAGVHTEPIVLDPGPLQQHDYFAFTGALITRTNAVDLYLGAPMILAPGLGPGRVYRFVATPGAIESTPSEVLTVNGPPNFKFGRILAEAGDLNADGHLDLVVAANEVLYILDGTAEGVQPIVDHEAEAVPTDEWSFLDIAAGDVDGDGVDELVMGDWGDDRVLLLEGSNNGLQHDNPTRLIASDGTWANGGTGPPDYHVGSYGRSLDMGDLDGDGVQDLVVGATGASAFAPELIDAEEPGAVYLHLGSPQGLDRISRTKVRPCGEIEPVSDSFGALVRVVGDLDRDGTDDVVISGVTGPAILYGRTTWPAEACAVPWNPTPPTVACDDVPPPVPEDTAPPQPTDTQDTQDTDAGEPGRPDTPEPSGCRCDTATVPWEPLRWLIRR